MLLILSRELEGQLPALRTALGESGLFPRETRIVASDRLVHDAGLLLQQTGMIALQAASPETALIAAQHCLVMLAQKGESALYALPGEGSLLCNLESHRDWPALWEQVPATLREQARSFARSYYLFPPATDTFARLGQSPSIAQLNAEPGEWRLWLAVHASRKDAESCLATLERELAVRLTPAYFARQPLVVAVADALTQQNSTIAVAESCTGGLLSSFLTDVPGSSSYFREGFVVYSNEAKTCRLGLSPTLIREQGPVSAAVAGELARTARMHSRTDYALAITGLAGPAGGTTQVPIGTVFIGLATPEQLFTQHLLLSGERLAIKRQAVTWALYFLWCKLNPERISC